ncbi:MAG: histidine kinase [Actinomycetota bacterium]|nr:histidine kinase [Actinomycetota bacterium]
MTDTHAHKPSTDPPVERREPVGAEQRAKKPRPVSPITSITPSEAATALRALPFGGMDDSTRSLRLPAPVQATISPVVAAIRWGTVMFGLIFAADEASNGLLDPVVTLGIVLFVTTWRTLRPIRLGSTDIRHRLLALTDTLVVGIGVGINGAFSSGFVFCVLAAATVGAFGWGMATGLVLIVAGVGAIWAGTLIAQPFTDVLTGGGERDEAIEFVLSSQDSALTIASFALTVGLVAFARARLLDAETRRQSLTGRVDMLVEANDLLRILNQVARTLPTSLDLREAMDNARDQIREAFGAEVVALVVKDEQSEEWIPQITDGCALRPSSTAEDLPPQLAAALTSTGPLLKNDLADGATGVSPRSGSGVYTAVRARERVIGVLAVEHPEPNRYGQRDRRIMDGLSEVLALTVDNARSFRRLRTLGAEQERSRIARDLHDRIGQWLSYISFELERIITTSGEPNSELEDLYGDVQTAIDELRETLRQLRSGVTEDKPLALVARELVERFNQRGGTLATFTVTDPAERLPVPVENELLRVLQEGLSNVTKHADATRVDVVWDVRGGTGTLTIADNGRGFDPERGIRDSAYGLVGMRERADVVGARLTVRSTPGKGTQITVRAGAAVEEPAQ